MTEGGDGATVPLSPKPEATVTIEPAEMVSVPKRELELVVRAARLFAAVFEGEIEPEAIFDEAADAGLTVETDAPEDMREFEDVDTYVELSSEFLTALDRAEEAAGILA